MSACLGGFLALLLAQTQPTNLRVEGSQTPPPVVDNSPDFDARNNLVNTADRFLIEVSSPTGFVWNTGAAIDFTANGMLDVPSGTQSGPIRYGLGGGSTRLTWNQAYTWRIQFRNNNATRPWSAVSQFTMAAPSAVSSANGNGAPAMNSWRMVGVPVQEGTTVPASELLDDTNLLYRWEEPTRTWVPVGSGDLLEGGQGYLAYTIPSGLFDLGQGTVASGTQVIALPYTSLPQATGQEIVEGMGPDAFAGNHLLSNPFNAPIHWGPGGNVFKAGVSTTYHKWDGTQYLVYNSSGGGAGNAGPIIAPFQGFGAVANSSGGFLIITQPAPLTGPPRAVAKSAPNANVWHLEITAQTPGGAIDTENIAGVDTASSDAWDERDSEEPGAGATSWVLVSFEHWDWATNPRRYTHDFRNTPLKAGDVITWDLTVASNTNEVVTLAWPNIAQVPTSDWRYTLEDPGTGATYDLSATSSAQVGPLNGTYPMVLRATRLVDYTAEGTSKGGYCGLLGPEFLILFFLRPRRRGKMKNS